MKATTDLLENIKQLRQEAKLQRLFEGKGYLNPQDDLFGLNRWTCRLISGKNHLDGEKRENILRRPDHLVSFLAIPSIWGENLIDTNSLELRSWVSEYKWLHVPGVNSPFSYATIQACSEGLLLPERFHPNNIDHLQAFLLMCRDGVVEFGLGQESYYFHVGDLVFQLIRIVGRLWQYLAFVNSLYGRFIPHYLEEIIFIVNIRGTEKALIGNLAEGWKDPVNHAFDHDPPRCPDKHLQIKRKISTGLLAEDMAGIVRWFAKRIDNAWGQFEPRCYVHRNLDESEPFAQRQTK